VNGSVFAVVVGEVVVVGVVVVGVVVGSVSFDGEVPVLGLFGSEL
jgi:hypothetical protein